MRDREATGFDGPTRFARRCLDLGDNVVMLPFVHREPCDAGEEELYRMREANRRAWEMVASAVQVQRRLQSELRNARAEIVRLRGMSSRRLTPERER